MKPNPGSHADPPHYRPPRVAAKLLGWLLADEGWDTALGDFEEYYNQQVAALGERRARWWYRRQVLFLLPDRLYEKLLWRGSMFANYLKVAVRNLRKHRGYAFINVLGLALGLACCLVILVFIRDQLAYDQYHAQGDRVYRLSVAGHVLSSGEDRQEAASSVLWGPVVKETVPEVQDYARFLRFTDEGRPWRVTRGDVTFNETEILFADPSALSMFSWPLVMGNPQTALREPGTVVLTEATAETYFGTASPMGKQIQIDIGDPDVPPYEMTVTGVINLPRQSHFTFDFLLPAVMLNDVLGGDATTGAGMDDWYWRGRIAYTYLLLAPNADPDAVTSKIDAFVEDRVGEAVRSRGYYYEPFLQRLDRIYLEGNIWAQLQPVGDLQQVYLFVAIALFLLAIACINFINLATARSAQRAREVGVRKAMGAHREQLVLQFLAESVVVSLAAFVVAAVLAWGVLPVFYDYVGRTFAPDGLFSPLFAGGLVLFGIGVGVLAGSYPAFVLSRYTPAVVLKGGPSGRRGAVWFRRGLVGFQFVLSVLLVIGTLTVVKQVRYMRTTDVGFDKEQVLVIGPPTSTALADKVDALREALHGAPSIRAMTAASGIPGGLGGGGDIYGVRNAPPEEAVNLGEYLVDASFVDLFGLEVVAGRDFRVADDGGGDRPFMNETLQRYEVKALLNEEAVRQFGWASPQEALGKQIVRDPNAVDWIATVVGVVRDFHPRSLREPIPPGALILNERPSYVAVKVEAGAIDDAVAAVERAVQALAPDTPVHYDFLDARYQAQYEADVRLMEVFGYLTFLAVFIACLGLFGLAAFMAAQRTKEIGIRKAVGASVGHIMVLLGREYAYLVVAAFVVAAPIAYVLLEQWLQEYAYRIDQGVGTFVLAGLLALVVAVLTIGYQAFIAARANPVDSLRYE